MDQLMGTQIYLSKNRKLHKFATTNSNYGKIYDFQTVHSHIFANDRKLHKFAKANNKIKCILQ